MRKLFTAASIATMLMFPAIASARIALHGSDKLAVVQGSASDSDHTYPSSVTNWRIYHCTAAFQSTTRSNWAMEYTTRWGNSHRACIGIQGNGWAIVKVEHDYWTPVVESDEFPCQRGAYPGQPNPPWGVINDLFRTHCPSNRIALPGY